MLRVVHAVFAAKGFEPFCQLARATSHQDRDFILLSHVGVSDRVWVILELSLE